MLVAPLAPKACPASSPLAQVSLIAREVEPDSVGRRSTLASDPTFIREAPSRACFPKRSKVVLRTSEAVVIYGPDDTYAACLLRRGVPIPIEGAQLDSRVLGPPALALGGPLVAYAVEECDPTYCYSDLVVEDLRSGYGPGRVFSSESPSRFEGITALRVSPRGDLAWVDCYQCTSRSVATVVALGVTDTRPRTLGAGRGIAPQSLEIDGKTVRWRRNGRPFSATLR